MKHLSNIFKCKYKKACLKGYSDFANLEVRITV